MLWLLCCALWFACRVQRSCSLSQWQPDAFLSPAELVRSKGYPAEEHVTVTEDGYVLSLQRVPRGGRQPPGTLSGPPVLLVHGLLSSAAEWVINYPHQSLGQRTPPSLAAVGWTASRIEREKIETVGKDSR
ncbi:hypothetical protein HPB49_013953 [Dermacentor silvarum]|uniref:Uncharacterized protein n=1 Tax=Dermacentor silvarum TaxID=543639 RepID=A0ACB8C413_DERSI|nr:hypothetical protein HPB49_013953 [Dermacentor silvarum]